MQLQSYYQTVLSWFWRKPVFFGAIALGAVALLATGLKISKPAPQSSAFYEVKRGDFLVSIVEGGTLEAVNEKVIRSEVEGTARIIYIVPEGSYVKKGDMVVELDSSASTDAVNQQQINVEKAQFAVTQAEQQLAIQKSVVDSEIDAAKLKMDFAKMDKEKFISGEADQLKRNAEIEITNVLESLEIAKERLKWTEELIKDGYETKSNLDKDRLTVSQTTLKLEQARKELEMVEKYDIPKKRQELTANLDEAIENLARVENQGKRKLEQYEADLKTQQSTLRLSEMKLARDKKQLEATKIYAPQDGLVVYAGAGGGRGGPFSSESMIEEGAVIRNRQEIIKLPDISEMKLLVKIHESHINNVRIGLPAYVVLDAMPDQRFNGQVSRVAPLPDSSSRWANPNLKVYATEIVVTDPLPNVKPGVSARAEIVITNLQNVLTMPIHAVTTAKGKPVIFLASAPQRPVPVTVGLFNTKFIEVSSGIKEGDRVLLSPPFDQEDKDLGGSIIADGEKPPAGATNPPAQTTMAPGQPNGRNGMGAGLRPDGTAPAGVGERRRERPDAEASAPEGPGGEDAPAFGRGRQGGEGGLAGPPGQGSPGRFNREEMLKQFDKNGDGELDESERAAIRERFGRGRRQGGATNATPEPTTFRPNAER